jgi:hypothetical protein
MIRPGSGMVPVKTGSDTPRQRARAAGFARPPRIASRSGDARGSGGPCPRVGAMCGAMAGATSSPAWGPAPAPQPGEAQPVASCLVGADDGATPRDAPTKGEDDGQDRPARPYGGRPLRRAGKGCGGTTLQAVATRVRAGIAGSAPGGLTIALGAARPELRGARGRAGHRPRADAPDCRHRDGRARPAAAQWAGDHTARHHRRDASRGPPRHRHGGDGGPAALAAVAALGRRATASGRAGNQKGTSHHEEASRQRGACRCSGGRPRRRGGSPDRHAAGGVPAPLAPLQARPARRPPPARWSVAARASRG